MADEVDNDDQWLYGDQSDINQEEKSKDPEPAEETPEEPKENGTEELPPVQTSDDLKPPGVEDEPEKESEEQQKEKENDKDENDAENGDTQQNGDNEDLEDDDDDDDDDSEDDVNVVIEDIKTTPSYTSLNIKRGGLLSSSTNVDKSKQQQQQAGKFTVEEFDQAGTINGVPATEYNLDSLEDKPWRKPGADITDYFNYGFNEDTWRAYCERQKRMRMTESGAGLAVQMGAPPRGTVPILNDNSKYSGNFLGVRKAGPPPGRRMTGSIDVIGGTAQRATPTPVGKVEQTKMNVIQVMTADRREYSRKPTGFPDMSVPPPNSFEEYQPEYGFNPEPDPYYGGYEPTQDLQWGPDGEAPNWAPNEIKPLTPVNGPPPPPSTQNIHMVPPPISSNNNSSVPAQQHSPHSPNRRDSKDRERDSERGSSRGRERSERPERERSRDRDRERSHRRKRSRSRSRRHKSRSRSPSHRSHRKKKGRRHDDSD